MDDYSSNRGVLPVTRREESYPDSPKQSFPKKQQRERDEEEEEKRDEEEPRKGPPPLENEPNIDILV